MINEWFSLCTSLLTVDNLNYIKLGTRLIVVPLPWQTNLKLMLITIDGPLKTKHRCRKLKYGLTR